MARVTSLERVNGWVFAGLATPNIWNTCSFTSFRNTRSSVRACCVICAPPRCRCTSFHESVKIDVSISGEYCSLKILSTFTRVLSDVGPPVLGDGAKFLFWVLSIVYAAAESRVVGGLWSSPFACWHEPEGEVGGFHPRCPVWASTIIYGTGLCCLYATCSRYHYGCLHSSTFQPTWVLRDKRQH